MTLSPPAQARFAALLRAADLNWRDLDAAERWGRVERVVAGLPSGDAADRELASALATCSYDELEAELGASCPDANPLARLDLLVLAGSVL